MGIVKKLLLIELRLHSASFLSWLPKFPHSAPRRSWYFHSSRSWVRGLSLIFPRYLLGFLPNESYINSYSRIGILFNIVNEVDFIRNSDAHIVRNQKRLDLESKVQCGINYFF